MSSPKLLRLAAIAFGLALTSAAFAQTAAATDWTPDSEATWVARTTLLANIADNAGDDADVSQLGANMGAACEGLQSEQMSHEYGKVPRWALTSQLYVCSAYARWSGKSFMASKRPCSDLKMAVKALADVKPGTDPDDVVQAAGDLDTTLQMILTVTADHKKSCIF